MLRSSDWGPKSPVIDPYNMKEGEAFAPTYLRAGGDVFIMQARLGDSTLDMVQHYERLAEIDIEQAHQRASPADNWRL